MSSASCPQHRLGGLADDGEDRAFGGLRDGLVRRLRRAAEARSEPRRRRARPSSPASATPRMICERMTPELPRAPISAPVGHRREHPAGGCVGAAAGFFHGRAHRQEHVRPGVAVGHGEDVDGVDLLDVALEPGGGGGEHLAHLRAIERAHGVSHGRVHSVGLRAGRPGVWGRLRRLATPIGRSLATGPQSLLPFSLLRHSSSAPIRTQRNGTLHWQSVTSAAEARPSAAISATSTRAAGSAKRPGRTARSRPTCRTRPSTSTACPSA